MGGPIQALQANVLPCDPETGAALNASRDINLIGLAWNLPGLVLPMLLGQAFSWFPSKAATYRAFFLIAAVLGAAQSLWLFGVPATGQATSNTADVLSRESKIPKPKLRTVNIPCVAAACDGIFFKCQAHSAREEKARRMSDRRDFLS